MLTVGLTGGVASGKSTVGRLLEARGARRIDADVIARDLTARPGVLVDAIVARFGRDSVNPEGGIDRIRVADVVFGDAQARRDLEALLHPAIRTRIADECDTLRHAGFRGVVCIEAALLVETGRERVYDRLIVVEAPRQTKVQRQVARGRTPAEARARLDAQAPAGRKLLVADVAIWNDGTRGELEERVAEVWSFLTRPGSTGRRRPGK